MLQWPGVSCVCFLTRLPPLQDHGSSPSAIPGMNQAFKEPAGCRNQHGGVRDRKTWTHELAQEGMAGFGETDLDTGQIQTVLKI